MLREVSQKLKAMEYNHTHPFGQDASGSVRQQPGKEIQEINNITQQAINVFLLSKQDDGQIKGIGYWQTANGYTAILQHDLWSNSSHNIKTIRDLLYKVEYLHSDFINEFNDDTLWWAICLLSLYDLTHDRTYMNKAAKLWLHVSHSIVQRGQNTVHGMDMAGGVFWTTRPGEDQLNAITTGLFAELSALLAALPSPDYPSFHLPAPQTLLQAAKTSLDWIFRCRYRQHDAIVLDTIKLNTHELIDWTFTYTTGQTIAACAALFAATGDSTFLSLAEPMARHAMTRPGWVSAEGVLTEEGAYGPGNHDPAKNNDAVGFKSVLVRGLAKLHRVLVQHDRNPEVRDAIRAFVWTNFESLVKTNTNGKGQYGPWWAGPMALPTSHSQLAVLDVMAAVRLTGARPFPV